MVNKKVLIFDEDMDDKSLEKFSYHIDEIREHCVEFPKEGGDILYYMNCNGGMTYVADIMLNALNKYKHRVVLICVSNCNSCALTLALKYQGEVRVLDDTIAIAHQPDMKLSRREMLDSESGTKFFDETLKKMSKAHNKEYKDFLTEKEMKRLKKGKDIFLSTKRFRKEIEKRNATKSYDDYLNQQVIESDSPLYNLGLKILSGEFDDVSKSILVDAVNDVYLNTTVDTDTTSLNHTSPEVNTPS